MNMLYFLVPLPGSKHRKDVPAEAHDSPVILVGENPTDSHSEKSGYLLVTFLVAVTDRQSQSQKQFKGGKDFAHSIESMGAGSKGACHIVPIIEKKILVLRCLFAFFPPLFNNPGILSIFSVYLLS